MSPLPAGGGVGGKPGVHHGNGALGTRILQIQVEFPQLVHQKHTLVYHRPGGEGANIRTFAALLKDPADYIQPPVKGQPRFHILRSPHKALVNAGHGILGPLPQHLRVYRHLTPAQEGNALLAANHLKELLGLAALEALLREEKHTGAIVALFPQGIIKGAVELVGHLQQYAYAVAHLPGGILTGPVFQPFYNGQGIVHHIVAGDTIDIYNRADAAGIVLKGFLIQCLFHGLPPYLLRTRQKRTGCRVNWDSDCHTSVGTGSQ